MPVICFRKKLKLNGYEQTLSFAFNCAYNDSYHLELPDHIPHYFDCGDFNIKIDNAIDKLSDDVLLGYDSKNGGVRYMALLNYFYDNIPELYSIKFESKSGDSIYYVNELKNK